MSELVKCPNCGEKIEVTKLLEDQIRRELEVSNNENIKKIAEVEQRKFIQEREKIIKEIREQTLKEVNSKKSAEQELLMKRLENSEESYKESKEMNLKLMNELMEMRRTTEKNDLMTLQRIEEAKEQARIEALKAKDDLKDARIAELEKKHSDTIKVVEELRRKQNQGSQQTQGEVHELMLEKLLADTFISDRIAPVAKGIKGADIAQTVISPGGKACGVILYEVKQTKNFTNSWIDKLKEDMRANGANLGVIVTSVLPSDNDREIQFVNGVWICLAQHVVILTTLLRSNLIDIAKEKFMQEGRESKGEQVMDYITSHHFIDSVTSMGEVYLELSDQIKREKAAFEKQWKMRELQLEKLFKAGGRIIGGLESSLGSGNLPKIRGFDLLEEGQTSLL